MSIENLSSSGVTTKIDYDGGTNATYIGETPSGTATSVALWRIKKLTYDVNNNVTDIQWANKEPVKFTVIWDNRASLNYS